jgi:reactive chlorine resistance protein C
LTGDRTVSIANDALGRGLASLEAVTRAALYLSLAAIYFWFAGMKFTEYEAQGLVPLVSNSPLLSWFYAVFSVRGFSTFLGFVEISIGLLVPLHRGYDGLIFGGT